MKSKEHRRETSIKSSSSNERMEEMKPGKGEWRADVRVQISPLVRTMCLWSPLLIQPSKENHRLCSRATVAAYLSKAELHLAPAFMPDLFLLSPFNEKKMDDSPSGKVSDLNHMPMFHMRS